MSEQNGQAAVALVAEPLKPQINWGTIMLAAAIVLAGAMFNLDKISSLLNKSDKPDSKPTPVVVEKLFQSKQDAEYFAAAARHVAVIVKEDGESPSPRVKKSEQHALLVGYVARSLLLGDLKGKIDGTKLAKFLEAHMVASGVVTNGDLTKESRAKLVTAWEAVASDALTEVK